MKKNIAVIYGGDSSEYVISVQSGAYIKSLINQDKYNVIPMLFNKKDWRVDEGIYKGCSVLKDDFSIQFNNNKIKIDCAIIVIHGTPGENGILQAYFDLVKIPYLGCTTEVSVLTFNKYFCNNFLRPFGYNISKSILVKKNESFNIDEIYSSLGSPIFIKPNSGGSSFGISKIYKKDEINSAIHKALQESDEVILEQFIGGTEITCGMVKLGDKYEVFPLCEIVSKNDFFDYEAKYDPKFADEIVPARISKDLTNKCKQLSIKLYEKLSCKGIVRFDYILKDNKFYFLEVNTIPGATKNSIVPKMIRESKITLEEIYDKLIEQEINVNC